MRTFHKEKMLVKSLVLGSAAVSADHFRAISMSIVNGPTETDVTILRTMAWRWGQGWLFSLKIHFKLFTSKAASMVAPMKWFKIRQWLQLESIRVAPKVQVLRAETLLRLKSWYPERKKVSDPKTFLPETIPKFENSLYKLKNS